MIYVKKKNKIKKIIDKIKNYRRNTDTPIFNFSKFIKIFSFLFVFLLLSLYLVYLFLFPVFITEENVESVINTYLSKNSKFVLDVYNLSINPNYKFDVNIRADSVKLKYSKNRDFISVKNPKIDINLFTLFFGYIDLNKVKIDKLSIDTNFTKAKKYDCFNYFSPDIFDLKSHDSKFEFRNINLIINDFYFNLYDENIKKNFLLHSSKVKISSFSYLDNVNRPFNIQTSGDIKSSKDKIIDFTLNLSFKVKQDTINKFSTTISKLNYNPLKYAKEYKFYSKADIDLKISPVNKKINIDGNVKLVDYTFNIKNTRLPKNNITIFFKGDKVFANCDFNFIKNQFMKIRAKANISKNKFIELNLNSSDINIGELKEIVSTFTKILNIKFNTDDISLKGFLNADLYLKSNFKTITSKGKFEIKNANLIHKKTGLNIKNINSKINLQNNKIDILNTSLYVDNSKFYLTGTVDEKTNLNIDINSDMLNIVNVINLVKSLNLPSEIFPMLDKYIFKTGLIEIKANILGNIKAPVIKTNSRIKNLKIYLKEFKQEFSSNEILISAYPEKYIIKDIFVTLINSNIKFNDYAIKIPKTKLRIKENDIEIEKTNLYVDEIPAYIEGAIKNYKKDALNIILKFSANIKNNNLINIKSSKNAVPKIIGEINLSKEKLLINKCEVIIDNIKKSSITGALTQYTSKNPNIENIKVLIEDKISITIPREKTSFDVMGNMNVAGNSKKPSVDGDLIIQNVYSDKYGLNIKDIILNIKKSNIYANITDGKIYGFKFDLVSECKLLNNKILFDFINLNSEYINLNKMKDLVNNSDNIDIEILKLTGKIASLEAMDMILNNVIFEGGFKDDILKINKFETEAFNGKIFGSIIYNIKTQKTDVDILLKEINVRLLTNSIEEIKNMSIAATGKLSALIRAKFAGFDYDSLIKTMDGYIKFNINDGELNQFAKLERFLQAGNILSQSILKLSLNSTISAITKQNTGDFKTIEGTLKIKNNIADVQYIKTQGSNMSLYLKGKFNLLNQYTDMQIFGRIPMSMVKIFGPLGRFSTEQIVNKMSDDAKEIIKSITVSPIEKMMSIKIDEEDINKIPSLTYDKVSPTREFVVRVIGDAKKTNSIQYFKWRLREEQNEI